MSQSMLAAWLRLQVSIVSLLYLLQQEDNAKRGHSEESGLAR
jgi:hypothetical protein